MAEIFMFDYVNSLKIHLNLRFSSLKRILLKVNAAKRRKFWFSESKIALKFLSPKEKEFLISMKFPVISRFGGHPVYRFNAAKMKKRIVNLY